METRNVKISLETAQRWYNGTDNELKELALQTYPELAKKELPKSFSEIGVVHGWFFNENEVLEETNKCQDKGGFRYCFATENQAKSSLAMAKLSQLMAVYNNGWQADWNDEDESKFCIVFYDGAIRVDSLCSTKRFLAFKTKEIAEEFLENFREDIETYFNF
jgi:hypothetical protein